MNVLNAVPLIATASSKAIAFSLIMRMVRFPVLLCLGVGPARQRREESPCGLTHHMGERWVK